MNAISKYGLVVLVATVPVSVRANQPPTKRNSEKTWTGTVTAVNAQSETLTGKHWLFGRTFDLGERCAISTVDNREASLTDLRPGEQVKVHYQDVEGVLVADRIVEKALHYAGTVDAVDPKASTVTMEQPLLYQPFRAPETFRLAGDCRVMLADGDQGTLADVRPGDRVTVIYERPGGSRVAYRIRDWSSTFVGALDAIDLSARTVKAKKLAGEKTFDLADKCRIIVSNQQSGHLKDLVLGHQYRFSYRDVNGINVLDRIAPAQEAKPTETASTR